MLAFFEFGHKYYKNRRRFEDIISDKRFPYLRPIYDRLLKHDGTLTDVEILQAYDKFTKSMQSNSFAISELELAIISVPCHFRPHLSDKLLERGLEAIIASIGEKADFKGVGLFIDHYILRRNSEPYGGLPPKIGTDWLKTLKTRKDLLETALHRTWSKVERDLAD